MAGPRADVEEALGRATRVAGREVLHQPRRLRAVLSDLVGRAGRDHRAEVGAVVTAAEALIDSDRRSDDDVLQVLRGRGLDDDTARWAITTLQRHGVAAEGPSRPATARPRWAVRIGVAAAVVAVPVAVLLVLLGDGNGGSPDDTMTTTSTTTGETDSATGFRVDFDDAAEGAFVASRSWEISDERVTGTVSLTPTAEAAGTLQHRELVPAEAFTDPDFAPAPTSVEGDVATFTVTDPAGEPVVIEFEADLVGGEPDEATVQSWLDDWRERVGSLRPLDPAPPASASITPLS